MTKRPLRWWFVISSAIVLASLGASIATAQSYYIDVGGSALTGSNGTQWIADSYYTGGQGLYTSSPIANTPDIQLYRGGREGLYTDFNYIFPLSNGSYTVTLKFAEIQYNNVGNRVFNVVMNGATILQNFDIVAAAGAPLTAVDKTFQATVTNGKLELDFNGVVNRALVNGISVVPSGPAGPSLGVSPTSLTFSGVAGGASPASQSVAIANNGGGTLSWSATSNQSWLTISPASGTGAANPSVAVNTTGLAAGNYSGTITLTATGAAGSPATVGVSLAVTPGPSLGVSPTSLTFSGVAGGANPASQNIAIANNGGGTLSWSAASNQSWLTISPASGSGATNPAVSVSTAGLAIGNYSGTITLTAPGATSSPATVGVSLAVTQSPSLGVSPTSLTFSGTAGASNPASQTIAIANNGGGTLSWSASRSQSWLTISPASGTGAANASVSINTAGLAAGSYSGAITVTAGGAAGSPATVGVSLNLAQGTSGTQSYYIDTGGSGLAGSGGITWAADNYGTGGEVQYTSYPIANTPDIQLYRSAREGLYTDFNYIFPLSNGAYTVTLKFAEVQYSNVGNRLFNVIANGATVLQNFDIVAAAGAPLTAVDKTFPITVTNGSLELDFNGVANRALVNAIAIVPSGPPPGPSLGVAPTSLTFSGIVGGSNPASQSLGIANNGGGTLSWSASSNQSWLTISPSSGTGAANPSVSVNTTGLSVGNYSGTITLTAAGATGSPATVAVTLAVTQSPSLGVAPTILSFSGTTAGGNPASQSVAITNSGGGALNWSASSNQTWLTISPASGTGAANPSVSVNTTGLAAGNYSGTITLTAPGATGSPATVAVSFAIAQSPSLGVSPTSLSFSGMAGGTSPASQSLAIANNGGGTLTWSSSSNQSWLTISPASGTGAANPSVSVNTTGLAAGNYSGTITLTAPGAAGSPATVAVSLAIAQNPALGVSPTSLTFSGTPGGANPASQNITIANNGGGTLTWSAASNQTWLTISPASGAGAANPSVSVNTAGLAAGNYSGTITLTASGATGSPATVAVSLAVTQNPSLGLSPNSLTFSGTAGASNPASQSIAIVNNGGGTLSWSATSSQTWLTISPASGTGAANPSVSVNTTGLTAGSYSGTITVTAGGAGGSPATVSVGLNVAQGAAGTQSYYIEVGGSALRASNGIQWLADSYFNGGQGLYTSFPIANTPDIQIYRGGREGLYTDFNYIFPLSNGAYTVTLKFAEIQYSNVGNRVFNVVMNGATILQNFDIVAAAGAALTAVDKTFPVTVTNGSLELGFNGVVNRALVNGIAVVPAAPPPVPSLGVAPTSLTFSGVTGGSNPAAQSVAIANNGGGTLSWSATSNQTWLTISPASGTGAANPTVSVNTTGLAAGNYSGTITLTAPGATGSPATVAVSLAIAQGPSLGVSPTSRTFSGVAGGSNPASQSVAVANNGGGTLSWSATSNQTWLTISPASGTGAANPSVSVNTTGLAAGNYSGTITLTAPGATGSPATVAVSLAIAQGSSLGVSPTSLTFSGVAGGSNPASQSVAVANNGGGTLSWSATSNQSWLTISPASGTGAANPSVSVNTTGLAAGNYSGTITLTAPGATGSPATVAVSLAIAQGPSLGVSPTSLTFSGVAGGSNPASQSVAVTNNGGGTLSWSATSNQTWLTISPASGTGAANPSVSVNTTGLASGNYSGTITLTAPGATGSPATVSVSLAITQNPSLGVSPTSLTFSGVAGGNNPASQSVAVNNNGGGTLSWSATSNQSWLTISPASGTGAANPSVSVNTTGLASGNYSGTITLTAPGATGSPATVAVSLAITQNPSLGVSPTSLTFSGVAGGSNPASQSVAIANNGGGTLSWSATSNQTWLTISPASGTGAGNSSVSVNTTGLTAGNYSGTITLTAPGATGSPATVAVSLAITQNPSLGVSPTSLTFSGTPGGSNPASQSVAIANNGGGTLSWSAASNQSWLTISPASGTGAGNPSVSVNTTGLTAGNYSGTITLTAPGATGSPATVAVSLAITQNPSLGVSPTSLTFSGTPGGSNPASQSVAIANNGGGTLNWSAASNQSWLTISPASGTGAANPSVSVNTTGLAAGNYSGTITLTAPGATGSPATVAVSLAITQNPSLGVSPTSLTFSGVAGGSNPAPQSVAIANNGGGTLSWSAPSNQTWLTISPASGTGAANPSVSVNTTGLTAGNYSGTVTLTAPGATGSPATVAVSLAITQPPSLGVSPTSLTFSGSVPGANPSNQAFAIVNNGGGTLNWSVTSNQTWLTISPASGTGAANPAVSINNFGMTAGTYSATLTVTAAGSTQTLSVSLTLNQNPILTVAPNTLTFSGPVGGSNPAGQTFAISNTGSGTFNWSLSSNQPWLTFSPGSGTGGTGNPTVSVNTAGLAAGTYTGAINVTAANAENTGAQINVTLNVIQTPGLGLSPTTMTFTGIPGGGNPASQTLAITNSGGGTLNWSATSNQTWLTISQSSGTGAANPSVSVNTTGLAVGSYSGTITLTASGATGSPGTVNVSLTVTQSPSLSLSPNTLTFSGTAGSTNPAPQTAAIANNGGGTLNWSAVSNQSWLSVSPASGAGAANPSISVNTSGLTAGNYSGTVTVTAAGAVNSPATVAVSLNLGTPAGLTISPNTMSFCGTVAGTVSASQTMAIGNTGAGVLNWSATSNQTWLTVTPASGTGAGNVAISASAQGLAPGTYSGTVTIAAPRIAGSPAIANVNINVTAVPSLQLSPVTISFSTTAGGSNPPAQSITIANSGGGNLNWIANFRQPWISLSQSSGTGPATILVTPSLAGLAAGVYDDTISIYAAGAAVPTQSVVVTATVTAVSPPSGNQWYAATTGSPSGDGSINNPWDLQTALYQPTSVQPGDTIWVRGGTYGNGTGIFYAQLVGTAQAPIIVRQYPGERAIIDGWMQVGCCDGNSQPNLGSYVWIWDLEFANTITDRTGYPNGPPYWGQSATEPSVDDWAPNSKLINLVIHDTSGGPGWWDEATNSEAYGNIIYYNGYQASDGGHGHGFYTQNDTGTKLMSDNIVFDSFSLGVQIYGSGGESYVRNFDVDGNIAFNNGVLAAGTPPPHADNILFAGGIGDVQNVTLTNNFTYQTPADTLGESELGFAWSGDNIGMTAINNYFMGGFQGIDIWYWDSLLFTNNVSYVKNVGAIILGLWTNANESASSYVWDQNTYYGLGYFDYNNAGFGWANWSSASGLDPSSVYTPTDPTGVWTFVRPNKYEPGRANIVIYNWDLVSSVPVNVSGVLTYGQNYKVQDAENFFGNPVTSGTYTGSPINIPMTGLTPAAPNGTVPNPPVHTAPQFGVFVLLPQ